MHQLRYFLTFDNRIQWARRPLDAYGILQFNDDYVIIITSHFISPELTLKHSLDMYDRRNQNTLNILSMNANGQHKLVCFGWTLHFANLHCLRWERMGGKKEMLCTNHVSVMGVCNTMNLIAPVLCVSIPAQLFSIRGLRPTQAGTGTKRINIQRNWETTISQM